MTTWLPDIGRGTGPLYCRIADSIEQAIESGELPPGAKLPPQRNLAFDIGVTIGTISRAYALAVERGLVNGEVGRGTYVLGRGDGHSGKQRSSFALQPPTRNMVTAAGTIRLDGTAAPDVGQASAIEQCLHRITMEQPGQVLDYVRSIPDSWAEAGSEWLASGDWRPEKETVVPTLGAHAAIMAAIATVTVPGDRIVMEELSYASVARSLAVLGRRVVTVPSDQEGPDPAAFDALCAQQHPRLAFLMPSLQNPTGHTMPEQRRRALAEIAKRHNVWLVEDAVYDSLARSALPRIASFAPERTFVVGSLSKAVAAGIRGGWVACPPNLAERVTTAHKLVSGGKPFVTSELAARIVLSGEANTIRECVLAEIANREEIVREILAGFNFKSSPNCPFVWFELPEPWHSSEFRISAARENVTIDDEDEFKPVRMDHVFHRVRIAFTLPRSRDQLRLGLDVLKGLLQSGIAVHDSYN